MSDTVDCPYCGHTHDDTDVFDPGDGDPVGSEFECPEDVGGCGKTFRISSADYDVTYYTSKLEDPS